MGHPRWPEWWDWELELSPHLFKRMADRRFSELDLRAMLDTQEATDRILVEGRWVIIAAHRRRTWEVVVEPDADSRHLVVVTAYEYEGA